MSEEVESRATIQIDRFPIHASGALQINLQHFYDLVAVSLKLAEGEIISKSMLPGSFMQLNLAANIEKSVEDVRFEFQNWIIRTGMRDCIEALSRFLEDINHQCAWMALYSLKNGKISGSDLDDIETNRKKFHQKGLPAKLETLKTTYTVASINEREEIILTLNRARNCLVHRGGRIQPVDLDNACGSLEVNWYSFYLHAKGPNGIRPLQMPNAKAFAGEDVEMVLTKASKLFKLGEPVIFTAQEFSEICNTFYLFGQAICSSAEDYLRSKGYKFAGET